MRAIRNSVALLVVLIGAGYLMLPGHTSNCVLWGEVKGAAPDGRGNFAFHVFDRASEHLLYRAIGQIEVAHGTYAATFPIPDGRVSGDVLIAVTQPDVRVESLASAETVIPAHLQGIASPIAVLLQGSTPGTQQSGHANISGTMIAGAMQTGAFQLTTGAGAGKVLTSDASGKGSWQSVPPPSGSAGGDLGGSYPNPFVVGLQTRPVSSSAPSNGQVLKWNGTAWAPATDELGSLTLPFTGSATVGSGAVFSITNTATSGFADGIWGRTNSTAATGVLGWATATSGNNFGGFFRTDSTGGRAVLGSATASTGATYGVIGASDSVQGTGVYGVANAGTGATVGVSGTAHSPGGIGVLGSAPATSGSTYGGYFRSDSFAGTGVYGLAASGTGQTYGVVGQSDSNNIGAAGVFGQGVNRGGYFTCSSDYGTALEVVSTGSNIATGVFAKVNSPHGTAVIAYNQATQAPSGNDCRAIYGINDAEQGTAIAGWATSRGNQTSTGVYGLSSGPYGVGVQGSVDATTGFPWGVYGTTSNANSGSYGVVGIEPQTGAGHAVFAMGSLAASGVKQFQIDHPLDPANYYLNHFCSEGPEPYNVYRGNVVTDAKGYATITLPAYFQSINRDPTYQLTVIDDSEDFVMAKVVRKVQNNQFVIRTSKGLVEVSWEVKGIRNDRWVQRYGFETEQEKDEGARGMYLHPELFGQPAEKGMHFRKSHSQELLGGSTKGSGSSARLASPKNPAARASSGQRETSRGGASHAALNQPERR
jgi:hypothetical protein